jgi:hypothetical protein
MELTKPNFLAVATTSRSRGASPNGDNGISLPAAMKVSRGAAFRYSIGARQRKRTTNAEYADGAPRRALRALL